MVNELYFQNDPQKMLKHHYKLIDYFQTKSIYRKFAIEQLVYHYETINNPRRVNLNEFVAMMRTKEAYNYIQTFQRVRILDVLIILI